MSINQLASPLAGAIVGIATVGLLYLLVKRYRKAEKQYHDDFQGWI